MKHTKNSYKVFLDVQSFFLSIFFATLALLLPIFLGVSSYGASNDTLAGVRVGTDDFPSSPLMPEIYGNIATTALNSSYQFNNAIFEQLHNRINCNKSFSCDWAQSSFEILNSASDNDLHTHKFNTKRFRAMLGTITRVGGTFDTGFSISYAYEKTKNHSLQQKATSQEFRLGLHASYANYPSDNQGFPTSFYADSALEIGFTASDVSRKINSVAATAIKGNMSIFDTLFSLEAGYYFRDNINYRHLSFTPFVRLDAGSANNIKLSENTNQDSTYLTTIKHVNTATFRGSMGMRGNYVVAIKETPYYYINFHVGVGYDALAKKRLMAYTIKEVDSDTYIQQNFYTTPADKLTADFGVGLDANLNFFKKAFDEPIRVFLKYDANVGALNKVHTITLGFDFQW